MNGFSGNLDLLLGVDLEVTADIGSATLSIAKILALGPGSVVEFRKSVEEPVELKVNGATIARGEIVAVDGRFGLRIVEIVTAPKSATAAEKEDAAPALALAAEKAPTAA